MQVTPVGGNGIKRIVSDKVQTQAGRRSMTISPDVSALDAVVVRRSRSLFGEDMAARDPAIRARFGGARVLIVGGGGSIGSITTRLLLPFGAAVIHVIYQNENYLTELMRDLRGSPEGVPDLDLRTLALDYGSPVMKRFLAEASPYDIVLNFAAMKHVRSEKDIYSLLQMLDTNLVRHARFLNWLADYGHGRTYFAVSTDKAANPMSLMGASKRLMEDLVFARSSVRGAVTTSARFANVAFSNGSLLQGLLTRLAHRQPFAAPRRTSRYFISQREAGELCILAASAVPNQHIAFPRLEPTLELQSLESIAVKVLGYFGLEAELYDDESAARRDIEMLACERRWPLVLTPRDTSGEKEYEQFISDGERVADIGMATVMAISHQPSTSPVIDLLKLLDAIVNDPQKPVDKAELVRAISNALPGFRHVETGRNLDQRL
jgi:FlaA1/EpsC-like NDP-sugar epimerase